MARENTLEAFQKAIDLRADMIEFDGRRTRDKRFVIYHNQRIANKSLKKMTFSEVRMIARTMGFHIPELEEVLHLARGRIGLDIELKERGYEREVVDQISKVLHEKDYIISSFYAGSLARVKQYHPGVKTGFIFRFAPPLTKRILAGNADWLFPSQSIVSDRLLERAGRAGKKIAVWTVNDTRKMKRLLGDHRVNGIFTDRAEAALVVRAGLRATP